jgi:tetratricopeptide (TPR) repeat protein
VSREPARPRARAMVGRFVIVILVAIAGADSATAQRGADARERLAAGRAAFEANDLDAAVQAFERAVAIDGSVAEYHVWLGRALQRQLEHASLLRQPFIAKRARGEYQRAIELDPRNVPAREGLVALYIEVPPGLGGSVDKAREQAESLAAINPLRGHFARASIADRERNPDGMEPEYRAAVSENPDSAVAHLQLVQWLLNHKRRDDAFAVVDAWQANRPKDLRATFAVGALAAATGSQLDRGERALRQVIERADPSDPTTPNMANVHLRLGDLLVKKGARDEARVEYERALELNPKLQAARAALKNP